MVNPIEVLLEATSPPFPTAQQGCCKHKRRGNKIITSAFFKVQSSVIPGRPKLPTLLKFATSSRNLNLSRGFMCREKRWGPWVLVATHLQLGRRRLRQPAHAGSVQERRRLRGHLQHGAPPAQLARPHPSHTWRHGQIGHGKGLVLKADKFFKEKNGSFICPNSNSERTLIPCSGRFGWS